MINEDLREYLDETFGEIHLFNRPAFDESIIGITNDFTIVYSFELMVDEYMKEQEIEEADAREFIDYNYCSFNHFETNNPIIVGYLPFIEKED